MDVSSNLENASFEVVSSLPTEAMLGRVVMLDGILYVGDGTDFRSTSINKIDSVDVEDVTGAEGAYIEVASKTVTCSGRPLHIVIGANSDAAVERIRVTGVTVAEGLYFGIVGIVITRNGTGIYRSERNVSSYSKLVSMGENLSPILTIPTSVPTIVDSPDEGDNEYIVSMAFVSSYDPSSIVSGEPVFDCTFGMEFLEA